jgi:hypothetical protein
MSPIPDRPFNASAPAISFRNEWKSPSNYAFTILLLLGGDVVARALAQLAGGKLTPVAFSFGTVLHFCINFSRTLYPLQCRCLQVLIFLRMGILRNFSHHLRHWRA